MIDIRAKELSDAINRLCNILEGKQIEPQSISSIPTDICMCADCGLCYSLKYGHHCARI